MNTQGVTVQDDAAAQAMLHRMVAILLLIAMASDVFDIDNHPAAPPTSQRSSTGGLTVAIDLEMVRQARRWNWSSLSCRNAIVCF